MLRPRKRQKFGGFKVAEEPAVVKQDELAEEGEPAAAGGSEEPELARGEGGPEAAEGAGQEPEASTPPDSLAAWLAQSEAAAARGDVEAAFEPFSMESAHEESEELALLERLRGAISKMFPDQKFEMEPVGSFATDLRLPGIGSDGKPIRGELEVLLVLHDCRADSWEASEVRAEVVLPTLERVASWLRTQPGIVVKEFVRKARVPAVAFETKQVTVEVSVQNPHSLLNTWHMRDLCRGGWPGRLRALARLVKLWAKSKMIHSAKDGALSAYGWTLLVASYLQQCGALPTLLPWTGAGPYVEADEALRQVLDTCEAGGGQCELWRTSELTAPDFSEAASWHPTQFFLHWLEWMSDTVFQFVDTCKDVAGGVGKAPLDRRHIVSVRERTQEELREDVLAAAKAEEQWAPASSELFLLIEDPLSGENVGRSVWFKGFCSMRAEVQRARQFLQTTASTKAGLPPFEALLSQPPLNKSPSPAGSVSQPAGPLQPGLKRAADGEEKQKPQAPIPAGAVVKNAALDNLCWDFAKGNCKKGAKCKWVHAPLPAGQQE